MSEDNHSCPLTSLWGLEWRLQTSSTLFQPEKTDLEKVEAARKLAADCFYRQECFSARADSINTLCARAELDLCMSAIEKLSDNQKGINNYAQPSLQLASKLRNRSRQFVSSLDELHPSILKLKASFEENGERQKTSSSNRVAVNALVSLFKEGLESPRESSVKEMNVDCHVEDLGDVQFKNLNHPQSLVVPLTEKPTFVFRSKEDEASIRPSFNPNRFSMNGDEKNSRLSSSGNSNVRWGPPATPRFGLPGVINRPPLPERQNQPIYKQASFPKSENFSDTTSKPSAVMPGSGPPNFRTAHDELVAQALTNKRPNEVSSSSYGVVKKTLGVPRSGATGSFKPPIANKTELTHTPEPVPESIQNDKLKHLDPKMVELIQNEIMDKGAPITWTDIAGLDFVKVTVKEIVVFPLLRPDIFTGLRGPPKGLLLFGPPGTGKTLIGKCIACQSKSTFFSISASSLTSKWVGEGEKMVRTLFEVARAYQPSVVFIDEIDSLLSQRSDTEHESSRRIKTEFLVQLDGATSMGDERILVVGATNRPQDLDEAARRRLVKRLYVPLPEQEAREQIVYNLLSSQSHCLTDDDVAKVGEKSEGYSGADMSNLCKEAAMGPIRSLDYSKIDLIQHDDVRPISYNDFLDAFKQVRASVSDKDLQSYREWDEKFGSGK